MAGGKSDYLEGKILDEVLGGVAFAAAATVYVALFTAAPTDAGGGTECSGGSYARVAMTNNATSWPAASGESKSNGIAITFPTCTVDWGDVVAWGIFDASSGGNLLYWGTMSGVRKTGLGAATGDTITITSHGYSDGQKIRVEAIGTLSIPTGLSAGTTYYVRDSAANTFKLAATLGGAAIDLTADGQCYVLGWANQTVTAGSTLAFAIGALVIAED